MATKRISTLTAASAAALTDQIPIEDVSNATKKLTAAQLAALLVTGPTINTALGYTAANAAALNATALTAGTVPLDRLSGITATQIAAGAAIADTQLATISTTGKVANSATTATAANTADAIVARDGDGDIAIRDLTARDIAATGNIDGGAAIRATGGTAPASGVGAEMSYAGGTATFGGYNRGAAALIPTVLDGNGAYIRHNGADRIVTNSSGATFTGPAVFTSSLTLTDATLSRTGAAELSTNGALVIGTTGYAATSLRVGSLVAPTKTLSVTGDAGISTTLEVGLGATVGGVLDGGAVIRATGATAPAGGAGAEMSYAGGTATFTGINRGTAALTSVVLDGNATYVRYNGAERIVAGANGVTLYSPQYLRQYTVATMPSPAIPGGCIFVADAAGSPCLAISDGANWKRCDDMTVTVT